MILVRLSAAVFFLLACTTCMAAPCETVPPPQKDIATERFYVDRQSSVRDPDVWDSNRQEMTDLNAFLALITHYADSYVGSGDRDARACAMQALDDWSRGGALLGQMSGHGTLDRMFAVGGIALAMIKLGTPIDETARHWLSEVSHAVQSDVEERTEKSGVSNLTYWGSMAVAASGIVTGDAGEWQFGLSGLHAGLNNIEENGEFEREMGRGQRASHYQEYGAEPLVALARLSQWRGSPLSAEDKARLSKHIELVLSIAQNPQLLADVTGVQQKPIGEPGWLPLCESVCPTGANGAQYVGRQHDSVYIQLGGDTRLLSAVLAKPSNTQWR